MTKLNFLTQEEAEKIKALYGTPTFVYSEEIIEKQVEKVKRFSSPFGHSIRYSLKGNCNLSIVSLLNSFDVAFDAASEWEAMKALLAGVPGNKIMVTSQEIPKHMEKLVKQGVRINLSSLKHIEAYGRLFPNTDVSIRINPGRGTGGGNRLTTGGPQSSFGIWHEHLDDVKNLLKKYNLTVDLLHQHIGSGHDPEKWVDITTNDFLPIVEKFPTVRTINLGGGYRVKSLASDPEFDYEEITYRLSQKLCEFYEKTGLKLHVEYEPSSYIVANAGSLVTTIIDVQNTGKDGYEMIKIDAGLTEIMRPGFYGALHPLKVVPINRVETETRDYLVFGHCCILGDCLTVKPGNPEEIQPLNLSKANPDDLLIVERAGGYCANMNMKNFNSFPEAAEVFLDKKRNLYLIRKRQTFEQLVQNELLIEALTPVKSL